MPTFQYAHIKKTRGSIAGEEYDIKHGQQAQGYSLRPNGRYVWHKTYEHPLPPFGDAAFTCTNGPGEPGNFYAEYIYTPLNDLRGHDVPNSVQQILTEGEIMGFNFTVLDSDTGGAYDGYCTLSGDTNSCHHADYLSDLLLPPIDPEIDWSSQNRARAVTENPTRSPPSGESLQASHPLLLPKEQVLESLA